MRKINIKSVVILLLFCVGLSILLYQPFVDAISDVNEVTQIGTYEEDTANLDTEMINRLLSQADEYNQYLYEEQQAEPFTYRGEPNDALYDRQLIVDDQSETIAYLRIDKLNMNLPVIKGANDRALDNAVGHVYGTSLPVGGENTHAVLAGHTGMKTAKMFDRLTELEKGDVFSVRVLGRTLRYEVEEINVVEPEMEDDHLQIEPGRDLVTLYTCTPYGVNSHRLLVKGHRIETTNDWTEADFADVNNIHKQAIIKAIGIAAIPIAVFIIGLLFLKKRSTSRGSI